jgi:hypothetical protein
MLPILEPTPGGCLLAAALVVAGAPLFSAGLRTQRLRRHLRELQERPLAGAPSGFVQVRGRVALDGPLVGPLSGAPCAGYVLEVRRGASVVASIPERRTFRLIGGDTMARVLGAEGAWNLEVVAERQIGAGDALTENLSALVNRAPEVGLLRRSGATLTLVERSLGVGQECSVVGHAHYGRPFEMPIELGRTGTDAATVALTAPSPAREPDLWIGSGGHLEFLKISDRTIDPRTLAVPPWNMVGLGLGPLLTLAGLFYLARAADVLRSTGRF